MTYGELDKEIFDLGFNTTVDSKSLLVTSTNRALAQINRLRRATAVLTVRQDKPIYSARSIILNAGETYSVQCENACAVSFLYDGDITASVLVGTTEESITTANGEARKLLSDYGDITVTITAIKPSVVRFLAVYRANYAAEKQVPIYGDYVWYNIADMVDDISEIAGAPVSEYGVTEYDYKIDPTKKKIGIPARDVGLFQITYYRKIAEAKSAYFGTNSDVIVDIAEDLRDLLPLLVAHYVWIEDEPEKAMLYKNRYDEQAMIARSQQRETGNATRVVNRKGWR